MNNKMRLVIHFVSWVVIDRVFVFVADSQLPGTFLCAISTQDYVVKEKRKKSARHRNENYDTQKKYPSNSNVFHSMNRVEFFN